MLAHDHARYELSSVRECDTGTSATPPELLVAIKEAFPGTVTRVYYGSTEAGPATFLADADLVRKPGSIGRPAPTVDVCLDDGEVCVRSDVLMDGYFDQAEATAAALTALEAGGPLWYRTGDLGEVDEEGYFSIVGRARDVLRTGGETVSPGEVEGVVGAHPAVAEVAVVGMPDPEWGEVVCAVLVIAEGADVPTLDELRAHCEGRLARSSTRGVSRWSTHFLGPRRRARSSVRSSSNGCIWTSHEERPHDGGGVSWGASGSWSWGGASARACRFRPCVPPGSRCWRSSDATSNRPRTRRRSSGSRTPVDR